MNDKERLISLLKELFRFDKAELDFGIYRIMNQKKDEIQNFIENDLIKIIDKEMDELTNKNKKQLKEQINGIKEEANDLGVDYKQTKKYQKVNQELNSLDNSNDIDTNIYNDIYRFFKRYYDNGDFLSKRRYSKEEKYAIPYNGEEVYLHWANSDQYYVKTTEEFDNYSFQNNHVKVNFKVIQAREEKNNVKIDEARYFVLKKEDYFNYNIEDKELNIYFEYRALNENEEYKSRNTQADIRQKIFNKIKTKIENNSDFIYDLGWLINTDNKSKSLLESHLYKYTTKNTADYFIHKDLKSFLNRELDFYIKNEMIDIDAIGTKNEKNIEKYLNQIKVIKKISRKIINFLSQIEDFQKKLFNKKKFIIDNEYCLTLDKIPKKIQDDIFEKILNNLDQLKEWKEIYNEKIININDLYIDNKLKNLVIDTKYFDEIFKEKLLSSFENLNDEIEGLIINSENYQALNLIKENYKNQINCIYIDPPYNTTNDNFIYKDNYRHSSWLTMMNNRFILAENLLSDEGAIFISIDRKEVYNLKKILHGLFNNIETVFNIKVRHEKRLLRKDIRYQEVIEYLLLASMNNFKPSRIKEKSNPDSKYKYKIILKETPNITKNIGNYKVEIYNKDSYDLIKKEKPNDNLLKRYTIRGSLITQSGSASEYYEKFLRERKEKDGYGTLYKVIDMGVKGDGLGYRFIKQPDKDGGNNGIYFQGKPISNNKAIGLPHPTFYNFVEEFNNCSNEGGLKFSNGKKPIKFLDKIMDISTIKDNKNGIVLDYFAGSGTTAHSIINLNKNDNGNRKYILVEMENYFNEATKLRIKNIMYSQKWENGKPISDKGFSHIFKYQKLEQYEDTLDNIEFESNNLKLINSYDDYLIKYMLDYETKDSVLNIDKFADPFNYKITITENKETVEKKVNLVETFNYLIGLKIKSYEFYNELNRKYKIVKGKKDDDKIVVIWRSNINLDLKADKEFIENNIELENYNKVYINGDNYIENSLLIEDSFQKLMFQN